MQRKHTIAHAPRSHALANEVAAMRGGCVGCRDCSGLCAALLEAIVLPGVVLKEKHE